MAFTGTLASMTHAQAQELVAAHGGEATEHVSRKTTMLVVGEEGWPLEPDGQPSQKLQKATALRLEGQELRILPESDWLRLLGLEERRDEIHRLYTPAMLSQLLDLPVHVIRKWERAGLIAPVKRVYRLPYFDFQEVTSARRIVELLEAELPPGEIAASLDRLRGVLDIQRPLAQLEILGYDGRLLVRDRAGLIQPTTGQRYLDFDGPPVDADEPATTTVAPREARHFRMERVGWTAEEWFREGCQLLDAGQSSDAVEAFRLCLMERPGDAEAHFYLAEALYRQGNASGALERYYAAVESDGCYLEAWTQLGCVHAEQGDLERALDAFEIALSIHPDYPDAHWQAANVLEQLGRLDEARAHWGAYLEYDGRGPWAEQARQRLDSAQHEGE